MVVVCHDADQVEGVGEAVGVGVRGDVGGGGDGRREEEAEAGEGGPDLPQERHVVLPVGGGAAFKLNRGFS